jgi:ribosomal-protein-alanine N-acetyltransferase
VSAAADPGLTLSVGAADAGALAALHAEAFDAPWNAAAFAALLDQPGVFGVREAGGFILCRTVLDEAEILTLAVRPDARRAGLASRLVEAAAGLAARGGAERLFLEVAEDNAAARALYDRLGFIQTGRRRGYYARAAGRPSDALLLALNLTGRLPTA